MPLFRRDRSTPPAPPAPPAPPTPAPGPRPRNPRAPAPDLEDWRSYGPVAAEYARVLAPRTVLPSRDLVELVGIPPGARVLDVGTGTGVGARAALEAARPALVLGIDPSRRMLDQAAQGGGASRYAAAEIIDLPFRDGSIGYVLACFVMSHVAKYDTALYDMVRVLAPGGRVGIVSWGPGDDEFSRTWNAIAEEFAEHELLADARDRALPWAGLFADPDRTRDALHDAGLRDVHLERREYRFASTAEDYLVGREITPVGRFLRTMLGDEGWEPFRQRVRQVFAERFPPTFNDFRDTVHAIATRPE